MSVSVQEADFDLGREIESLSQGSATVGAVASFVGLVRGASTATEQSESIAAMTLEHYPGMTETALAAIEASGRARWLLQMHHHDGRKRRRQKQCARPATNARRDE